MATEIECTADAEHPCGKTNGTPCAGCLASEAAYRAEWERYGRREYERERDYARDMIEAGRGHLLRQGDYQS